MQSLKFYIRCFGTILAVIGLISGYPSGGAVYKHNFGLVKSANVEAVSRCVNLGGTGCGVLDFAEKVQVGFPAENVSDIGLFQCDGSRLNVVRLAWKERSSLIAELGRRFLNKGNRIWETAVHYPQFHSVPPQEGWALADIVNLQGEFHWHVGHGSRNVVTPDRYPRTHIILHGVQLTTHYIELISIDPRYYSGDSNPDRLQNEASIFVPWFAVFLGFCIYSYGFWKIESSSYGVPLFLVGLGIFLYGANGVLTRLILSPWGTG